MDLMRFRFALVVGATIAIALPLAAQTAASPQAKAHASHHTLPKPTNLQVLPKDISNTDLLALMRGYTKALGVECEFCHAEDPKTERLNYALDTKPDKTIARTMITMTDEINAKYLSTVDDPDATPAEKTVTCATCHRGSSMPMPFRPAPAHLAHHGTSSKSE
jgi:Photosynthetic reaction centre cytochrome C subunit